MLNNFITQYRQEGFSIIPVPYKSKRAIIRWFEFQKRQPTDSEIQRWFSGNNTNVAVICGKVSGNLVALDCDSEEVFYELTSTICPKVDVEDILDFTRVSETGRGYQIWLRTKEPVKSMKFPKLDIKGEGGYVIAPPSIHPNGKQYKFVNPDTQIRLIDNLCDIGVDVKRVTEIPSSKQPNWVSLALSGVIEGQRNDTCLKLAGYFKNKHPQDITETILLDWNTSKNKPPLPEAEILSTITSAYSYTPASSGVKEYVGGVYTQKGENTGQGDQYKRESLRSLTSIIKSAVELPTGLWGDFLFPESIVFLSGEAGAGKTTFIYNLAAALSCGDTYLSFKIPHPLKVLIYDLESPDGLIKSRSRLIDNINSDKITIGLFDDFGKDYLSLVKAAKDFDVVIIDTVSKAFLTMSEDDNAEARREMKLVRNFTQETGACVILLHHMGKVSQGRAVYKARGASARPDLSDIVINFESIDENIIRFHQAKNRFVGGDITFFLRKLEGQFEQTHFAGYTDSMDIFKAQQMILELLSLQGELLRNEIVKALGDKSISRPTVDRALGNLRVTNKIDKPRRGVYTLSQGDKL